jgi:DNA-binding MurR/RpiR family transcriptional regulator
MEKPTTRDLFTRIRDLRTSFSVSHERIAVFFLEQPFEAALLTATELAQELDMDPATVVRFAQKMGYRGYLELKGDLRTLARTETQTIVPLDSLGQAIQHAKESLSKGFQELWDCLDRADLVQIAEFVGTPCTMLILTDEAGQDLGIWLAAELGSRSFHVVHPGGDPDAQSTALHEVDRYDRALILDVQATPLLGHQCQELSRKKVRTLVISTSSASPILQHADVALRLPPSISATQHHLVRLFSVLLYAVDELQQSNNLPLSEGNGDHPHGGSSA